MPGPKLYQLLALSVLLAPVPLPAQQRHVDDRAAMESFQLPSHGSLLNAFVYLAAGPGPHPAVILLHGFPGNERNLDLAQDIRRAGWDVLYFDYRGSWGSPGNFSFIHGIEDTAAALAYLRNPTNAQKLRLDPNRIVLLGHSMGGFNAVQATAADPGVLALGIISAADIGSRLPRTIPQPNEPQALKAMSAGYAAQGMAPLAGTSPDALARETLDHHTEWAFPAHADAIKTRPVLIITSDDGNTPQNEAFAAALKTAGDMNVVTLHLATDHSYSDQRPALSATVLKWLDTLGL